MAENESGDIVKHLRELNIAKKQGDREGERDIYFKMGRENYSNGNFKQAAEYCKLSLNPCNKSLVKRLVSLVKSG